jgi:PleD family two-component response regulator
MLLVESILMERGVPHPPQGVWPIEEPGMNRHRVLVIDDDPLFRSLIMSILGKEYFVSAASEGSEGYYKAIEQPPRLIIVDVLMPGWDGLRTVEAIRAHQDLAHIPIMILTSDASRETVVAAIERGANDYVLKTTLTRENLLKKTHQLIELGIAPLQTPVPQSAKFSAGLHPTSGQPTALPGEDNEALQAASVELQSLRDNWE